MISQRIAELTEEILKDSNLNAQDTEAVKAYVFASVMRDVSQSEVLAGDLKARDFERKYSSDMRAWADKRPDLFGNQQVKEDTNAIDPKRAEALSRFKSVS